MGNIGVDIPQDAHDNEDGRRITDFARAAERVGYESLWVTDSAAPGVLSPLATLAFAAASTTRLRLGVAVLISALQAPLRLARDLATVDRLSAGRLVIGVGIGNDRASYARHGLDVGDRAEHFAANVHLLRRLLRDDLVSNGPWWPLQDQPRPMVPLQLPTPPIWFGARRPAALQRAVRLGDGWIGAGSMSLQDFEGAMRLVEQYTKEMREEPGSFQVAKRVYAHLGPTTDTTKRALTAWFEGHYNNGALADQVVVAGPADELVAHLSRLRELGVSTIVLHPVLDAFDQMSQLAEDVLPQVPDTS